MNQLVFCQTCLGHARLVVKNEVDGVWCPSVPVIWRAFRFCLMDVTAFRFFASFLKVGHVFTTVG